MADRRCRARVAALAALAATTVACADRDPRILATYRVGVDANGFVGGQLGAHFYYDPPTLVDGFIYVGTSRQLYAAPAADNFFLKLDGRLRQVWATPLGLDEVRGAAALDGEGRIFFVVERGRSLGFTFQAEELLTCLAPDGRVLWQQRIGWPGGGWSPDVGMFNPAVAADGTIYAGASRLFAFDGAGAVRWAYPPASTFVSRMTNAPILDREGNLYFVADGALVSLLPDGSERWRTPLARGGGLASPAFSFDRSRVYAAGYDSVSCVRATDGVELWAFSPPGMSGDFRATPAVDDAGNVYLGEKANKDSKLFAISADGALLWEKHVGADLYSSPALGDDRTLYVGSELTGDHRFHAIDMATGATRWALELQGDVTWSSPALAPGGTLYVGSMDGNVYAIRSDATGLLPNAGSPRFHGGNSSTGRGE